MNEGFPKNSPEEAPQEGTSQEDAFLIRHSKSVYETYAETEKSENPRAAFDPDSQVVPDLTEEGIKLAREKAEEFFDGLDPAKDKIFFVSSNEVRALQTANIYREVAEVRGFQIIKPEKSGSAWTGAGELSEQIGGGKIRTIENLSLNPKDTLVFNIFLPEKLLRPINWDNVDPEFRKKWEEAREIIRNNDRGSYGGNLHAHSEDLKKIFPEIETTKEMHKKQLRNLVRLMEWAEKKFDLKENRIKVIGFGHENYILQALDEYFHEKGINNCEAMGLTVEDGKAALSFRGKSAEVEFKNDKK